MSNVFDARDNLRASLTVGEEESTSLCYPRLFNCFFLKLIESFLCRSRSTGLPAARQTRNHIALALHFLLPFFVRHHLLRASAFFLGAVLRIVTFVSRRFAALNFNSLCAQLIQEFAIVRDDDHRDVERLQVSFEPLNGVQIEMICRFVEK